MKFSVNFRLAAERDAESAWHWHEQRQTGLGDRLFEEIQEVMKTLAEDADRFPFYQGNYRRILLNRFPYKLFYTVKENQVVILRILHAKQSHQRRLP